MSKRLTILFLLSLAVSAEAQVPLTPEGIRIANRLFDGQLKGDSVKCSIRQTQPSLDFVFRYDAGFFISCRLHQFEPHETLISYLRVNPQDGSPVLLGEVFEVPEIPPDIVRKMDPKKLKEIELQMSGAFALGEGRYSVEVLLLDKRGHTCRKRWTLEARKQNRQAVPLALKPHTVAPLVAEPWDGKLAGAGQGVRLTVLLHATPMNPRLSKLYAWDRAFLLQTLASLLKQLPCQSVRVVAFNLDQQREIFRQEQFDAPGFMKLASTLRNLELGTVSYKALQRQTWRELLVQLTREQTSAKDPSDAVIFLGPTTRFWDKVPKEMLNAENGALHFFYLEYYPWMRYELPDAIDYLTRDLHGTVFRIHSPDQLGQAIQKMLGQMGQIQKGEATPSRGVSESSLSTQEVVLKESVR